MRAERHHREDVPVEVVVEVEVAREAGAGEVRLVPAAVGLLRLDEPLDRAPRGLAVACAGGVQAESAQAVCDAVEAPRPLQERSR